jgi:Copper transport outer membrane protein, MctB
MFDYRYHALSLAAVLLALAVGVVIGVAIGDSNLVSSAKSGIVHDLSAEVSDAQRRSGRLQAQLSAQEAFSNDLYPIATHGVLTGRSIGLVFLGGSSNRVNDLVRSAVTQGGGDLTTVVAVREPLDLAGLAHGASGTRYEALGEAVNSAHSLTSTGKELLTQFGALVGRQLVAGGALVTQELLSRVRGHLLSAFDGQLGALQGLVVMRSEPAGMPAEQAQAAEAFESGMIDGVTAAGEAAVGVELTSTQPSQIPWYQGHDMPSVDDLDAIAGQAALIYALDGSHGAFGSKPTADSLLPKVVSDIRAPR